MRISLIRVLGRPLLFNLIRQGLSVRRVYSLVWRNRASKHRLALVAQGVIFCLMPPPRDSKPKKCLDDIISHADELYSMNEMEQLYKCLSECEKLNSVEISWRLARVCYELGKHGSADKKRADELLQEGLKHARKAIELDSNHPDGYKWKGIILMWLADFNQCEKELSDIRSCFESSIQLSKSKDPTYKHMLGKWYFFYWSNSPWYCWITKNRISAIKKALEHFEKAEKIDPGFSSTNWLLIGKCYLHLDKKANAKEWLQRAADHVSDAADDKKAKEEAKQLLSGLK